MTKESAILREISPAAADFARDFEMSVLSERSIPSLNAVIVELGSAHFDLLVELEFGIQVGIDIRRHDTEKWYPLARVLQYLNVITTDFEDATLVEALRNSYDRVVTLMSSEREFDGYLAFMETLT